MLGYSLKWVSRITFNNNPCDISADIWNVSTRKRHCEGILHWLQFEALFCQQCKTALTFDEN